jgi:hypothetical protein
LAIVAASEPAGGATTDLALSSALGPPGRLDTVSGGSLGISNVSFGILGATFDGSFASFN